MDNKSMLKDSIIMDMSMHLSGGELDILDKVLCKHLAEYEIRKEQYLPATYDDTNQKYLEMFKCLKGAKTSEKTMETYMRTMTRFASRINKPLDQVNGIDVECYLHWLSKDNCNTSLNNHKRNISAFYTWMRKKHIMMNNPCDEVESYKEISKPVDYLSAAEMEAVTKACKTPYERAIVEFLRVTGVRVGELVTVKVSDIDWYSGKVNVFGHKTMSYRNVYLDEVAMIHIKEYLGDRTSGYLFIGQRSHEQLKTATVRDVIHNISERAGMGQRLHPHIFRHTCATNIVKRGGSVSDAGDYLGHKDQTTAGRHYVYKGEEHILNIFNKYVRAV